MQTQESQIERTARRRAILKLSWLIHAFVYVAVNLLLMSLAAAAGRSWAMYPLMGWAIGLGVHGLVVFLATDGGGLFERLVARERARLEPQRDPW
jgi:hypothetical protein